MKRTISLITLLVLCLSLLCVGATAEENEKTFIIGVGEPQAIDEVMIRRDFYENYLAKHYNVKFIFSEQLTSTEAELSFIENIVHAGADAYISYRSDDATQFAQVCEEYGLYYVINTARTAVVEEAFTGGYDKFLGSFGGDNPYMGTLFEDWVQRIASEDGSEGFMITSALAFRGNIQHVECTVAVLQALQNHYGLTYEDTVENIATTSAPLEVANDKGINIYIYPGSVSTNENWLQGVSAGLQTGKYGVFIQSGQSFTSTAVVVDEVERTYDMDIKVASVASMSDSLTNAFHTEDKFGNPSLNMATIKSTSLVSSMGFVQVYNAITGHENLNRDANGEPGELLFRMWTAETVEQIDDLSEWDVAGGDKWVMQADILDKCLGVNNSDLTFEEIQEVYNSVTYEDAKARLQ